MCDSKYPNDPAKQITDFMKFLSAFQFIGSLFYFFIFRHEGNNEIKMYCLILPIVIYIPVNVLIHAFIRCGDYKESLFTGVLWLYPFLSLS